MTIFIVDIEPVETRYTSEWKTHIPTLLEKETKHDIRVINGVDDIPAATTPGAFLNFGGTNVYKAAQVEKIGRLFCDGKVMPGDHFLFTDAWNPGILNVKYMSELLKIPVTLHGLWHAGSYDPADFLGRLIGDAPWIRHAEQSFYHAFDHNYFATTFHIEMFTETLFGYNEALPTDNYRLSHKKIIRTGWPMEYTPDILEPFKNTEKHDMILFPHRIAPEKQVNIFYDLAKEMPEYEWVVCQEKQLTKQQYHTLLGQSKMVFSCALQETLGIVGYEGALVGAIPYVPNRLSYTEMYSDRFKYPSEWTTDWESYQENKSKLVASIKYMMSHYDEFETMIASQADHLSDNFFSAKALIKELI